MSKATLYACAAIGLVFSSPAVSGSAAEFHTEFGSPAVYNGQQVRSFFSHNGNEIHALGVEVPAAMYDTAPMDPPSDGRYDVPGEAADAAGATAWYCCGYEIVVPLPESALRMSAFREVVLNWNPKGHIPPGVWDTAHTDFHFYFMGSDERLAIGRARDSHDMCVRPNPLGPEPPMVPFPQSCAQLDLTAAVLPDDQMAPGYSNVGAIEPAMGNHLLDLATHEFHGEAFTHTFIYMSNAGRLTGMEPMITLAYLRSLEAPVRVPISMPAAFPLAGLYPTEYVMEYDRGAGVFRVSYENWKAFPASNRLLAAATAIESTSRP